MSQSLRRNVSARNPTCLSATLARSLSYFDTGRAAHSESWIQASPFAHPALRAGLSTR
jgi:hypothetical protein